MSTNSSPTPLTTENTRQNKQPKPSFSEAFWFWLKLGFISFGGPAGQIAIMHEFLVDKKKWISESRFMHALNYTMLLPGPEAQQLASYTGWLLHGTRGGLVAGIFFVLPSMLILFALSTLYVVYGEIPWVYALFSGLKPAVMAVVLLALFKIGKKSLKSYFHYLVAGGGFIGMFFFNISFPYIILGAVILAILLRSITPKLFQQTTKNQKIKIKNEEEYFINSQQQLPGAGCKLKRLLKQISIAFVIWCVPFLIYSLSTGDTSFWHQLSFFFTKAAFVTFGGAYAVLPYVAQVSVEELGWLSDLQMVDGLALGETTPGPLVMVLVFVGYMAGFNHFGGSISMGFLGLLLTTFFTFVPCFLFIFAGAPIIEKTRENKRIKEALSIVTAAVVGVILNLSIYLGKAISFPMSEGAPSVDWVNLTWIAISVIALNRLKLKMLPWIGISALMGLAVYLLS